MIGRSGKAGLRNCQPKPSRNVAVEVELSRLDELHHADCGDELADRGDADRIAGGDGAAGPRIGDTFSKAPDFSGAIEGNPRLRDWHRRVAQAGAAANDDGEHRNQGCGPLHGAITVSARGRIR